VNGTGKTVLYAFLFIALAEAAGLIGSFITMDAIPTWYASLSRPDFAPPNWVFGPVWTALYALMGLAAFVVWRHQPSACRSGALRWYWYQLALNAAWSPIFFGLKNISLALGVIIALWFAIAVTTYRFSKVSALAAALLVPYLLWVSFALYLNYGFLMLN
jgi:tryptophan-rich sensory protein